jgi:DNA-binding response OmpR family regulator
MKILVVEDSNLTNTLVCTTLKDAGFETASAFDGRQGVDAATSSMPDLIVMDIMMPVMDGFEATRRIKTQPGTRHIPVIVLTSLSRVQDMVKALDAGADCFMSKPFNGQKLVERVHDVAQFQRQMKAAAAEAAGRNPDEIRLTGPKQQIFLAMFSALEQLTKCQVFSVLVTRSQGGSVFIVTTARDVPSLVLEGFQKRVFSLGERLLGRSVGNGTTTQIIYFSDPAGSPKYGPPFRSTIHAPFYVGEDVRGVLSVGATARGAYQEKDFKFLFELGGEVGPTLGKVTA